MHRALQALNILLNKEGPYWCRRGRQWHTESTPTTGKHVKGSPSADKSFPEHLHPEGLSVAGVNINHRVPHLNQHWRHCLVRLKIRWPIITVYVNLPIYLLCICFLYNAWPVARRARSPFSWYMLMCNLCTVVSGSADSYITLSTLICITI